VSENAITTIVVAAISAVGGGTLSGLLSRSKTRAEAESIATNTALLVIKDLREEIGRLSARLRASEQECEQIRQHADASEERAVKAEYDVDAILRATRSMSSRITYLTKTLKDYGIVVNSWTPPEGIGKRQ
jgi:hypothetical protein